MSRHGMKMNPGDKWVKVEVYTYDVWGNARDGYEVNDRYRFGTYSHVDALVARDDKLLTRFLKEIGFLKKGVQTRSLEFDGDDTFVYVTAVKDGYPLCEVVFFYIYND